MGPFWYIAMYASALNSTFSFPGSFEPYPMMARTLIDYTVSLASYPTVCKQNSARVVPKAVLDQVC